ncbi:hypothetical protein [Capnocytophaga catalasegens]|nr:hypothetical protein [Capnocytophaga catalasegens]
MNEKWVKVWKNNSIQFVENHNYKPKKQIYPSLYKESYISTKKTDIFPIQEYIFSLPIDDFFPFLTQNKLYLVGGGYRPVWSFSLNGKELNFTNSEGKTLHTQIKIVKRNDVGLVFSFHSLDKSIHGIVEMFMTQNIDECCSFDLELNKKFQIFLTIKNELYIGCASIDRKYSYIF